MADRYTKLFSLKENLYSEGTPVLISAGALSKDNQTGKVFVQLRMQNTDSGFRNIIALKVAITAYDPAGNIVQQAKEYQYLDLNVERGMEFGSKQAVMLDNTSARSFEVAVIEAVFSGGTSWTAAKQEWVSLGKLKTLEESMGAELADQYRRDTFADAKYELFAGHGVWLCACGTLNEIGENTCCHCHNKKSSLIEALDHSTLAQHLHTYKAENDKKAEENSLKKRLKLQKSINWMKVLVWVVTVAAGILSCVWSVKHNNSSVSRWLDYYKFIMVVALIIPVLTLFLKVGEDKNYAKILTPVIAAFILLQIYGSSAYIRLLSDAPLDFMPGRRLVLLYQMWEMTEFPWCFSQMAIESLFYVNNIIALIAAIRVALFHKKEK